MAREAFDWLLGCSDTPDVFPTKVKALAARELRESKDERRIWELAESGWKHVLADHRNVVLDRWLRDFNTPKAKQVSELFTGLLNLPDVTASWTWPTMSAEQARIKLDEYVTIRGNIAHRTKHDEVVFKNAGKGFLSHVVRLVEKTDEALEMHLRVLTNDRIGDVFGHSTADDSVRFSDDET